MTSSKKTSRDRYLLKKYGITEKKYDSILRSQGGGCAICGKTPERERKSLAVDHNHKTGELRGVLCNFCNHRLVGRHTDHELLHRVGDYLSQGLGLFVPEKKKRKRRKRKKK